MGRWRPSVTTIVSCAVPACASSVLGPSTEAWPSFALPTHARGPTHERLGPSPCCSAQPAAPGPFQECAGAPQSGVTPARGRASALFLGLHVDSSSASHAFLAVNVPDGEVACPVHLPSPSVASRGDVIICKVQISASFLGAVCPTGAQVGGQRLRPRGQGGGRLCQNGRRSRARGRPQVSRLGAAMGPRAGGSSALPGADRRAGLAGTRAGPPAGVLLPQAGLRVRSRCPATGRRGPRATPPRRPGVACCV